MAGKVGAPSKKTPENVKKLEEAFAMDCSVPEACFFAGITEKTYYNRVNEDEKLLQRFTALRNKPILLARQSVLKGMKEDANLALKYLERKKKDEFGPKHEIEHSGSIGIQDIVQKSYDEDIDIKE